MLVPNIPCRHPRLVSRFVNTDPASARKSWAIECLCSNNDFCRAVSIHVSNDGVFRPGTGAAGDTEKFVSCRPVVNKKIFFFGVHNFHGSVAIKVKEGGASSLGTIVQASFLPEGYPGSVVRIGVPIVVNVIANDVDIPTGKAKLYISVTVKVSNIDSAARARIGDLITCSDNFVGVGVPGIYISCVHYRYVHPPISINIGDRSQAVPQIGGSIILSS